MHALNACGAKGNKASIVGVWGAVKRYKLEVLFHIGIWCGFVATTSKRSLIVYSSSTRSLNGGYRFDETEMIAMISEFALFLFTLIGGIAAGAYVFAWAYPEGEGTKRWLLPCASLVLLAIGGVALLLHLGHPERMFYAFSNPNAGITREGLATGLFGLLVLVDFIMALRTGLTHAQRATKRMRSTCLRRAARL